MTRVRASSLRQAVTAFQETRHVFTRENGLGDGVGSHVSAT